ncbi:MAG: transporter substrate-binding domain-containing protein [Balneolaceae bacterium]
MITTRAVSNGMAIAAVVLFAAAFQGCSSTSDESMDQGNQLPVTVLEPIERDFADIRKEGVLRMITHYSSNTYFLHQGVEVGFEYELLKAFAEEHGLVLETVIVGANENPFDLLNSGEGDVIAANYTVTPERQEAVRFTNPYNLVNQVVVYSDGNRNTPWTLEELSGSGIPITVRRNSSYYVRLQQLRKEGLELNIRLAAEDMDTESLLFQAARGEVRATISDDNMFFAANRYMEGLIEGPVIAEKDTIAWAIRENSPELEVRMNRFLLKHFRFTDDREEPKRSAFLNILRQRYFEGGSQIAEYYNPEWNYSNTGLISPYDEIVQEVSDSLGLDWLMISSMIAQESQFNPYAKSWAGAVGLMQIIPRFSDVEYEALYDPEMNIREGARIIKEHLDHYAYLDSLNQWSFALATYNVGVGHMADARRLVLDRNKDPNKWQNVEDALLDLMQRRYYQDARHGFARGIETVQYVREIMNRHQMYQRVVTIAEQRAQSGTGRFGMGTVSLP